MAAPSSIVPAMASKTKTKKKHFVAQKVKLFRASDPLLSVLMWGVNHSVDHSSLKFIIWSCKQLCQHELCGTGAKTEKMGQNNFFVEALKLGKCSGDDQEEEQ
ncbi:hypothetical protein AAES_34565 [Amazona aestiva]|uniref:Uncharacterized protein n=1 Tax=Amazona aestiva TaxID=12930 RepID=A0A0Q3QQ91_AMAAE|nr:hypothetical protein AAES_34565 [Amazona aestiva]